MSCFPTQMWTVSGVRVFIKVVSVCGGGFSLGSSWSDSLAQHLVFDTCIRFVNVLKTKCCMYFCVTCSIICSIIIRDWRLLLFYFMWGRVCYCLRNLGVVFCL